jgi:2-polyprenyl-3-methyl-5-hydroxy-6-metoxy-1,4-benzoquinol methylase
VGGRILPTSSHLLHDDQFGEFNSPRGSSVTHQQRINEHFDAAAHHWRDLYYETSLEGAIHQARRSRALAWIQELTLPSHAQILEVGCGAGLLAIDLARRGFDLNCIDSSPAMVELAAAEARQSPDIAERLVFDVGDVHALGFESSTFDLVIALGVLPFLHSAERALTEMARVTRSNGYVLFSSDNRYRLNRLLDPRFTPFPGRNALKRLLIRVRAKAQPAVPTELFSYRMVERMTTGAGLEVDRGVTLGFGPFTFLGKPVLSGPRSIMVNTRLEQLADRKKLGFGALGAQHLILARKPRGRQSNH